MAKTELTTLLEEIEKVFEQIQKKCIHCPKPGCKSCVRKLKIKKIFL